MENRCLFQSDHAGISEFDMLDPHARACPHAYYKWLQDDPGRRIYKAPHEKSFYVVHTYEDVKFVLTNSKLFSSAILPTCRSPFLALMDGEDHSRQRDIANKIFQLDSPKFPGDRIQRFIADCTRDLPTEEPVDILENWATRIPLASLCFVFGIEPTPKMICALHEQALIINRALFVLGGTGPRRKETPSFSEKLAISFSLIKNLSRIRKIKNSIGDDGWRVLKKMFIPVKTPFENPRPDFSYVPDAIRALLDLMILFNDTLDDDRNASHGMVVLRQAIAEKKMSKIEAIMLCTFILFAGYETSVSLLSNAVYHLSVHPELLQRLKLSPTSIENFVEESLRFYTPVGRFLRRTTQEVTIGEIIIPKGAMIIAMLGAANADPHRFEYSYTFFSDREKNQHISFGKGIHFCVGAPLARSQASLAISELVKKGSQILMDETSELKMITDRDNGILRLSELIITMLPFRD